MKKLLGFVVLGLLLSGCVQNLEKYRELSLEEQEKLMYDRHARINLFDGEYLKIKVMSFKEIEKINTSSVIIGLSLIKKII